MKSHDSWVAKVLIRPIRLLNGLKSVRRMSPNLRTSLPGTPVEGYFNADWCEEPANEAVTPFRQTQQLQNRQKGG